MGKIKIILIRIKSKSILEKMIRINIESNHCQKYSNQNRIILEKWFINRIKIKIILMQLFCRHTGVYPLYRSVVDMANDEICFTWAHNPYFNNSFVIPRKIMYVLADPIHSPSFPPFPFGVPSSPRRCNRYWPILYSNITSAHVEYSK